MRLTWVPGQRRPGLGEIYLAIAIGVIAIARVFPLETAGVLWRCPLLHLVDIPCIGCGFTRSWVRVANLDLVGAFHVSPLGALLFLSIVAFVVFALLRFALRLPWPWPEMSRREGNLLRVGLVAVIAMNWVYLLVRHRVVGDWG